MFQPEIEDTGDGIRLVLPILDGVCITLEMDDAQAQDMINIIQNKLNARFK